jgi:hypothetical protein
VERSDSRWGISNADWADAGPCVEERKLASELTETPVFADLPALRARGLVYAPLPENGVNRYFREIYDRWSGNLRAGVVVLEDRQHGRRAELDYMKRFKVLGRASFEDEVSFLNSSFCGWFLVWIDFPNTFMTTDMHDFSGFCSLEGNVRDIFGRSARQVVSDFEAYAKKVPDNDGGRFFEKVAALYASQDLS